MTYKGGDPERGRKLLELRAGQCHTCEKGGANGIGPNLWGVVGRIAGTSRGYSYSKANSESAVVWSETELDVYLTNPSKYMPGTQMAFAGLKREKDRADVIAYLQSLQ